MENSFISRTSIKSLKRRLSMDWQLYLILLLPLIWLIVFQYVPMYGVQIAFRKFQATKGIWGSTWVGLTNFYKFFGSFNFRTVLTNTLSVSAYSLVAGFPFPIILALLLNNCVHLRYKKTVQIITYMPHFISTVVLVGMLIQFLSPATGLVNGFLSNFGITPVNFLSQPQNFKHLYVWSGVWQSTGWGAIIYLAALASADAELHDAAMIDGASRFKRMIYIDFPCIIPTATILLIMNAGSIMNVGFEKVFLMQNPLNMDAAEVISTFTYKVGLGTSTSGYAAADFSYASAIGLFNSVINFVLISTVNFIASKTSDTRLW